MYIPIWIIILVVLLFIVPELVIWGLILFALFWVLKWGLIILFGSGFLMFDYINKFLISTEGSPIIGFIAFLLFACYLVQCFSINTLDENNQASNKNIKNDDIDSQDSFFNKSIYKR